MTDETPDYLTPAAFEWKNPDDMLLDNPISDTKLSTGLPAWDRAMGGGIPVGSLVTLQGSPGAGKTSLAIQIAMRQQQGGAANVFMYLPDEGYRGGCTRVAQNLGFDRDKIAAQDSETMVAFGIKLIKGLKGALVKVCDPDHDEATLEHVVESARKYALGSDRTFSISGGAGRNRRTLTLQFDPALIAPLCGDRPTVSAGPPLFAGSSSRGSSTTMPAFCPQDGSSAMFTPTYVKPAVS